MKKDRKLLFKVNKEITFIGQAIKPFGTRQDLFLLTSELISMLLRKAYRIFPSSAHF